MLEFTNRKVLIPRWVNESSSRGRAVRGRHLKSVYSAHVIYNYDSVDLEPNKID